MTHQTLYDDAAPGTATVLHVSTCDACGRSEFPRRRDCPACGSAVRDDRLSGPGRLRASTAVLAQPPGSRVEAPYLAGVAEFPGGLCVIGLLAHELPVGARVEVVVHEPYPGGRTFAFRETDLLGPPATC
ncbi:MAG: hypothetical protein CMH83_21270 [Nocardioides sp.]|nr:hypothetical protein [Nocardioides sp.]